MNRVAWLAGVLLILAACTSTTRATETPLTKVTTRTPTPTTAAPVAPRSAVMSAADLPEPGTTAAFKLYNCADWRDSSPNEQHAILEYFAHAYRAKTPNSAKFIETYGHRFNQQCAAGDLNSLDDVADQDTLDHPADYR